MSVTLAFLVTYHNERSMLSECLQSVIDQTESVDEIIVLDDASEYPAAEYVRSEWPVRIIRSETNIGPAAARNMLLRASSSDFVHFHDADDLVVPEWAASIRRALSCTPCDVVFSECSFFGEIGITSERAQELHAIADFGGLLPFCIANTMLVPSGSYLREAVLRIEGYRVSIWQSEDRDFHIRLAASCPSYCVILEPLVLVRRHSGSRSRVQREVLEGCVQALTLAAFELPERFHCDIADAAAVVASRCFQLGNVQLGREAVLLSRRCGPPLFSRSTRSYRALARLVGIEMTELIAKGYRSLLPRRLRGVLRLR